MSFEMQYNKDGEAMPQQQEVTAPVEQEVVEQQAAPEQEQVQEQTESPADKNFRALREKYEREEKQRREAEFERDQYRKQLEQYAQQRSAPAQQEEEEDFTLNINNEDLVEGKHLTKVAKHIKKLEAELKASKQQSAASLAEARLKAQYTDFDKIVTKENLQTLQTYHPELAATINSNPDLYSAAVSAYTMLKKLNIAKEDEYAQDRARVEANLKKPRSLQSVAPQEGKTPLEKANVFANGLTEELRKQLHKEMIDAAKNY
jgi:hypothetical protein